MSETIESLLRHATTVLAGHSPTPHPDAWILLAKALGKGPDYLFARPEQAVSTEQAREFHNFVAQRVAGMPVAYLTGRREFWSLNLRVSPDTLIPRPETEMLVEQALAIIPADVDWEIADLGSGSGAIALAVAYERPRCRITATDLSETALALAADNARSLGITNLRFAVGHWYRPIAGRQFHMILSNPPYVADDDPHLTQGDVRFEPREALIAGVEGLDDLRHIINTAPAHLLAPGWLLLEHGYTQRAALQTLMQNAGFQSIRVFDDLGGNPRVISGRLDGL